MRKWLSILLNILVWLLPPGGTAVVVILAWLQRVPWYLIVLSAIATIALILLGINQFALFRQRRQKPLSKRTDKEIENTIRDWLYQPRYKFQMEKMAYDLRIEMARYGIGYIIDTDLKRNFLDDVILLDDLDEFSLYRRI